MAKQEQILDSNLEASLQEELRLIAVRGSIYNGRRKPTWLVAFLITISISASGIFLSRSIPLLFQGISFSELFEWRAWEVKIGAFFGGLAFLLAALVLAYYLMALWLSKKVVIISPHQILQCYQPFPVSRVNVQIPISDITKFEILPIVNNDKIIDYHVTINGQDTSVHRTIFLYLSETSKDIETLKLRLEELIGQKATLKK